MPPVTNSNRQYELENTPQGAINLIEQIQLIDRFSILVDSEEIHTLIPTLRRRIDTLESSDPVISASRYHDMVIAHAAATLKHEASHQQTALMRHQAVLILDQNTGLFERKQITPDKISPFSNVIDRTLERTKTHTPDRISDTPHANGLISLNQFTEDLAKDVVGRIESIATDIRAAITVFDEGLLAKDITRLEYGAEYNNAEHNEVELVQTYNGQSHQVVRVPKKNSAAYRSIVRKCLRLDEATRVLDVDTEASIASATFEVNKQAWTDFYTQSFKELLASENAHLVRDIMPTKKQRREALKRQRAAELLAKSATQTVQTEHVRQNKLKQPEVFITPAPVTIISRLSWLDEPATLQLQPHRTKQGFVFVTHAIHPKLLPISEAVRAKQPSKKKDVNRIDSKIAVIARSAANGHFPWTDMPSVKKLDSFANSTGYQHETIWYSYDKAHNANRVYFTMKQIKDLNKDASHGDTWCIIIMAETDKQNQIETLQHITGDSVSSLRSGNAGSI